MSDLSELIEINRNIERQNEEIIRLLKKIAGEEEPSKQTDDFDVYSAMVMQSVESIGQRPPAEPNLNIPKSPDADDILNTEIDVGEVYYVEDCEIYRLSVKNNETSIDNLTGSSKSSDFNLQELIANESIKNNQSLSDATVILTKSQAAVLPQALKLCYDEGAKKVYMPWSLIPQLVGAPDVIVELLNLTFYKSDEELLEMLFE
ncbi:MAG: hypothetical protein IJF83_13895 [Methanobrevibacter sp.]|nr:hypothetical protein [Methanobrevibacter sp.]